MMRTIEVKLTYDEQYPVFSVDSDLAAYGTLVSIPYDLWCEYQSALAMWKRMQEKLREIDEAHQEQRGE